ncbi:apolipoprotein N-acyltransferase [Ancylobacter terrae]|uniref:apolipoprotein N-acyltransferase n=1 Tax=Ancylobacter sp. sgz301288 TaxID=3342077 RepID=UPI00385F31ED
MSVRRLEALAAAITLATGWRRALTALGAGAFSALAMAPFDLWPILALTLPVLVWQLDGAALSGGRGLRGAFASGWWFGFGYFLAGLWWIGNAFLVQADVFAWLLPVAVTLLPAGLALFTGLGCALARLLWTDGAARFVSLAIGLTASEWLRGHVLTGFPWNNFGYALASDLNFAQSASVVGLWGLCFITLAALSTPAALSSVGTPRRARVVPAVVAAITLGLLWGAGAWRLATTEVGVVPDVYLRLMQPDLPQDQKFRYDRRDAIVDRYIALSESEGGLGRTTHLFWPESAFPFFVEREPAVLLRLAAMLPPQTTLVTGAARLGPRRAGEERPGVFNSLLAIDTNGAIIATADKVHLVPFGEYLPFQETLEALGLEQLTRVRGGFLAGRERRDFAVPGLPSIGPLICYEAIFPGAVTPVGARPGLLLNVSNDAWFGITPGPFQHFSQARLRAVEEGLPLVRVTNNGISAVIDPLGRIGGILPLGVSGVLDTALPTALSATTYASKGNWILLSFGVLALALVIMVQRKSATKS